MASAEQDDVAGPIEEARRVMEEAKMILVTLPLSTAFGVRNIVGVEHVHTGFSDRNEENEKRRRRAETILTRLDFVIPSKLMDMGRERFEGDLTSEVQVYFNYEDVKFIGEAALSHPPPHETIEYRIIDLKDVPKLVQDINEDLRSVLAFFDTFAAAGGRMISPQTKTALEQRMRKDLAN